ncbi:hypothetical protein C2G38_2158610 [Gigaspora rosea]|uniref:Peptidase S1 domain-containing protein n=1 Tax=Gigaspora rosea TaxID=44941 RepID=A0A397W3N1_9GLOM|nr:hypothetical protein C2G38_2158610 [Gigaspora rosea]
MRYIYFLINSLLLFFTFQKYLIIHAREPLAALWDIDDDDDEILSFIKYEQYLTLVDRTLKPLLDDTSFGGSYIDMKKNCVYVNTIDQSKIPEIKSRPEIKDYLNSINFIQADKSLDYLKNSFNEITNLAKQALDELSGIIFCINPKVNNVAVYIHNDTPPAQKFVRAISRYDPYIVISHSLSTKRDLVKRDLVKRDISIKILSGESITIRDKPKNHSCSAGFWAKSKKGDQRFLVSAGHCYGEFNGRRSKPKVTYAFMLIGKLSFSIWTAPYDFSLIDTKRMDARLKPSTSIKNEFSQRYPVSCGYVEAFNGAFINELGELYTGVTITNMLSDSGDSGSPAFSFSDLRSVTLNGIIVIRVKAQDQYGNQRTVMLPLQMILDKANIELITRF